MSSITPETLAAELDRKPFIPLLIRLVDGRTFKVCNPDSCHIARLALYLFRLQAPHAALAQDVQVISLRPIASVETIHPSELA